MVNKYIKSFVGALPVAFVLALASTNANAAMILVEICGNTPNCNDNDTTTLAGLTPLDKVDWLNVVESAPDPVANPQTDGSLTVTVDSLDSDGEGTSGSWAFTGSETLQYLSLKFDGYTAVFATNGETSGIWDTDLGPGEGVWFTDPSNLIDGSCCLNPNNDKPYAMSHIGVFVPVPAAVWLFGSGLLGLVGVARRKRA